MKGSIAIRKKGDKQPAGGGGSYSRAIIMFSETKEGRRMFAKGGDRNTVIPQKGPRCLPKAGWRSPHWGKRAILT